MTTTNDSVPGPARRGSRWLVWTLSALAGAIGLKYGWDFGYQLSGVLLGVVTAANCGVISALLVGAGAERLWQLFRRR